MIFPCGQASGSDCEAVQAHAADNKHRKNHDDAELGLIDTTVAAGHEAGTPVGENTGNDESDKSPYKGTNIGVAGINLVPVVRRTQENGGYNDADEDCPADHGALDQTSPQEGGLNKQREWTQKKFPVALVRLAAVEESERLDKRLLGCVGSSARLQPGGICGCTGGQLLVVVAWTAAGAVIEGARLVDEFDGFCSHVCVERGVPAVRRLRAEKEDSRKHDGAENRLEVKGPPPADTVSDLADDNGCEEGATKHSQVRERHARATLMDEVQVTNGGVNEGFKRSATNALNDASSQKRVVAGADSAGPSGGCDEDACSNDKEMALAPDTCRGHEEDGCGTDSEKKVSGQKSDVGEAGAEEQSDRHGVGGKDRPKGGRKDGCEGQDESDEVSLP